MTDKGFITEAIIAELHRQAEQSGCHTSGNGKSVQVDGSFDAEQLAQAVLDAIRHSNAAP